MSDRPNQTPRTDRPRRNGVIALVCVAFVTGMVGMSYAAVPLYEIFCKVTGYGGTTRIAEAAPVGLGKRRITVRFDANVGGGLAWRFRPVDPSVTVQTGAMTEAAYTVTSRSDTRTYGTATFNVEPAYVGKYFNKIQCFCFTEQTLQPGQEVRMPVLYYIDPAILDDKDAQDVESITLSYTFHPIGGEAVKGLDRTGSGS